MATITLKGTAISTCGTLPSVGTKVPSFVLTKSDLSDTTSESFAGKRIVFNIFPSIDTGICALSVKRFNKEASSLNNVVVLCISMDLPFAQGRFCGAEGLNDVVTLSAFRSGTFGKDFGLTITDGPLKGLFSRAVVITDEKGTVIYTEQVPEIAQEPDYESALKCLK
ncbi:MAG: thiol peroxidase [Fibrobacter sp.]|nr:thiol peroxidase [Fibrobacter sp.]